MVATKAIVILLKIASWIAKVGQKKSCLLLKINLFTPPAVPSPGPTKNRYIQVFRFISYEKTIDTLP